ncbi:MAG: Alkaline phosphatase synthesis sensor protein PhoR [Anaerolineales bacterium]|nr:Alkaline phosphatase synthesis sensor protein PhoR [Anaerolineales bacterium]
MTVAPSTLRRFEIFEEFTDDELAEVAKLCREERHHDAAKLFGEGDSAEKLHLVLEGKVSLDKKVQLGRSGSSRQATVSIQGPGQAVGWSSLVAPHIYTMSGVCIEPTKLLVLESDDMRRFVAQEPEAGVKLMNAIATLVRDRLEATTKTLTYFLSIISHELRSPLAAIENYLEVMLGGFAGDFTAKQTRMLERSALRVKDLRALISDVLDLARMQPEHIQADFEWFDPMEICAEAIEDVRLAAQEKGIDVEVDAPPRVDRIVGARRRLRQVCSNLLSNAIKYSLEGGEVIVRVQDKPDGLVIEVLDEGIGIPAEEQEHIFEDFFRARNVSEVNGTGLGLSIVKKIVEAHAGEISFESPYEPGKQGAKFAVAISKDLATSAMKQEEWEAAHA